MDIKAPRGTYDILPAEALKWQHMEMIMRQTAARFGYQEVRTPIFENTELFQRGVGESTDIVSKEMYTFADKSKRSLTLRPEGTASAVRCLIEHRIYSGVLPVKWFYSGPMFRYDRPQAGRYRQFHQFGVEAFGSTSPELDAEIIILMLEILVRLGLDGSELHINSVGCPVCRQSYRERLIEHISPHKDHLCRDCQQRYQQNPLRVLDCKEVECQQVIAGFPHIVDSLCPDCQEHYRIVQEYLSSNGVAYIQDHQLVRGLDYYTNTAFEVHLPGIGAQSAIGGGGRYNGLVQACGGPDIPGIGFALGMERILLALEQQNLQSSSTTPCDIFVISMGEEWSETAFHLLQELRQAGYKADKDYNQRSPKAQMKHADRMRARVVLFLGEEEVKTGMVSLKNMADSQQVQVPRPLLLKTLHSYLTSKEEEEG
ncbi:MAG TPA: histidine--tRNA ligase [Syntrophomonadaceae bacterium]|nr:histidine--tRNA ligase [Syntrophomonadaceae bacterium]